MDEREEIDQYDLVEIIQVPEQFTGVINIGDIGVVLKKYDEENFEVECIEPGASSNAPVNTTVTALLAPATGRPRRS